MATDAAADTLYLRSDRNGLFTTALDSHSSLFELKLFGTLVLLDLSHRTSL